MNILQGGSLKNMVNTVVKFLEKRFFLILLYFLLFTIITVKLSQACDPAYSTGWGCLSTYCAGYWGYGSGVWIAWTCVGGSGNKVCTLGGWSACTWPWCGPTPCTSCSGSIDRANCGMGTNGCPSTCTNGASCEIKGGNCCDWGTTGTWDNSEGKCIKCGSLKESGIYATTSTIYTSNNGDTGMAAGDNECESACGASADCDEKCPSVVVSSSVYCNSVCNSVTCDSSRNCAQVDDNEATWCTGGGSVGGYKYCTYDGSSWAWRSSYPAEVCTDSYDNDCDGINNCADPNCAGRAGPGGVTCCQSASNCPACSNNVNPTCVSNTCRCDPCTTTSQCISNYCCEFEKGGSQTCRYLGWVYGNAYLCG